MEVISLKCCFSSEEKIDVFLTILEENEVSCSRPYTRFVDTDYRPSLIVHNIVWEGWNKQLFEYAQSLNLISDYWLVHENAWWLTKR